MSKQYVYSLYDAKTGALRAKGTPQELMEQGYYNRAESVCTGYAHQKKKNGKAEKVAARTGRKAAKAESRTGPQDRHPDAGGMVLQHV